MAKKKQETVETLVAENVESLSRAIFNNEHATTMRDRCVEKLKAILDQLVIDLPPDADAYLRGQGWNSALKRVANEAVPELQSLTLDNGAEEK